MEANSRILDLLQQQSANDDIHVERGESDSPTNEDHQAPRLITGPLGLGTDPTAMMQPLEPSVPSAAPPRQSTSTTFHRRRPFSLSPTEATALAHSRGGRPMSEVEALQLKHTEEFSIILPAMSRVLESLVAIDEKLGQKLFANSSSALVARKQSSSGTSGGSSGLNAGAASPVLPKTGSSSSSGGGVRGAGAGQHHQAAVAAGMSPKKEALNQQQQQQVESNNNHPLRDDELQSDKKALLLTSGLPPVETNPNTPASSKLSNQSPAVFPTVITTATIGGGGGGELMLVSSSKENREPTPQQALSTPHDPLSDSMRRNTSAAAAPNNQGDDDPGRGDSVAAKGQPAAQQPPPRPSLTPTSSVKVPVAHTSSWSIYDLWDVPTIDIGEYLKRLADFTCCSPAVFVAALCLMDRFLDMHRMSRKFLVQPVQWAESIGLSSESTFRSGGVQSIGSSGDTPHSGGGEKAAAAAAAASNPNTNNNNITKGSQHSLPLPLSSPPQNPRPSIFGSPTQRPPFLVTKKNIFKFVLVAIRVASKVLDLRSLSNKNFAAVGGVSVSHLNDLEARFLMDLAFDVLVFPEEFQQYVAHFLPLKIDSREETSKADLRDL